VYELGTPITDEELYVVPKPFKADIKAKKKTQKEKVNKMDEWTYTADGELWTRTATIVANRNRKVTAYSMWKQNKTDNEVGACVVIEKNTKSFTKWKSLEKDEKQVYYSCKR
jgi:SLT domain-containing protein